MTTAPDTNLTMPRTGLPDLVLFTNQHGKKRIGEIQSYPEIDVNRAYANGRYIVEDSVLGCAHQLEIKDVVAIEVPNGTFGPDSYMPGYMVIADAWREHWMDQAIAINDALKEFGVGAHFTTPVGDGCAHYVVTAMKKTTCTVEWRGFSADNWSDRMLGGGGNFRIADIKQHCSQYPVKHIFASLRMPGGKTWAEVEATGLVPKGMID